MNRYEGLIFDLDGTLLNTLQDISDSTNKSLEAFGFPTHTYEEYKLVLGDGFRALIEKSLPEGTDRDTIDKVLDLFEENYKENFQNKTRPYDGVVEMLEALNEKGVKIAINSNKMDDYTKSLAHKFFSHLPLVAVIGERQGVPKKPDPITANEIIELMGLSKDKVMYVGDSNTDMLTANNAKLDSTGVTWGFRKEEELVEHGATYIAYELQAILDIVSGVRS